METKSFLFQNKKIQYKIFGKGKPVILVHGFGEDSNVWEGQINFLKAHVKLLVPDLPGSGQSEFIDDANIETYAEVIKALIEKESITQFTLIGHSMGGYVALAFAEKYAHYLKALGLFHSSAFADTEEKKETRKKAINFINDKGAYAFIKTSTPNLFTQQYKNAHPQKIEALIEAGKTFTAHTLIQYYEAMINRPDRTGILKTFSQAVLFIIGEEDQAIPFDSSIKQCHLPSKSHVHILRQSAHMGMWEEEQKVNNLLLSFLQQQ